MKIKELQEAVNRIEMKEEMQEELIRKIKARTKENAGGKRKQIRPSYRQRKMAAAAAMLLLAVSAAAFPARAFVNSLVKERMEHMSEEEQNQTVENSKSQTVGADSYTRAYTKQEEERYQELYQQYQKGRFPEGEIRQVDSEEEALACEFCYLTTNSCFYLPEREMTEEELLEIIDFLLKREYAVSENFEKEHAEEISSQKEKESEAIAQNVEKGGITSQQAIETAEELLGEIYGITGENMAFHHYYEEGSKEPYYCVNWSDIIAHQYYYFFISAKDGHLKSTEYSSGKVAEAAGIPVEEAERSIAGLHRWAAAFMEEREGTSFSQAAVYYTVFEDGTTTGRVRFLFEKEDGSGFVFSCLWDGTFLGYEEAELSDYEDGKRLVQVSGGVETPVKAVLKRL